MWQFSPAKTARKGAVKHRARYAQLYASPFFARSHTLHPPPPFPTPPPPDRQTDYLPSSLLLSLTRLCCEIYPDRFYLTTPRQHLANTFSFLPSIASTMSQTAVFPRSHVGFDSITSQIERKLLKRGFQFNVICVGKSRPTMPFTAACEPLADLSLRPDGAREIHPHQHYLCRSPHRFQRPSDSR